MRQACTSFWSFLQVLLFNTHIFCCHHDLAPHVWPVIWHIGNFSTFTELLWSLEPEILWNRLFKFVLAWALPKLFFSCYAIFTWIITYKMHDLADHQPTLASLLTANTTISMDQRFLRWTTFSAAITSLCVPLRINKSWDEPYFFSSNWFPLCPPGPTYFNSCWIA